ncbi:iron-containing redox enzyme family protein [Hyalangium rubrum]|uniref:Iron-containing redox enzyme family protein n=1 Tax=Hyalangium rubrum TaxID=3103134 RepID=A0ABU5GW38_9BACT|nr:iron-containing redox enzyme family protein [Hyalangium sp. s54d21]MDY7224924.1 iron-containing redox enzyme family protein [Hyalangium sp. s54d21]
MSSTLDALEELTVGMARRVQEWLPAVTTERYVAFLDMMYHYTSRSGDRLRLAASRATLPELKSFFAELASDEQEHYRLAKADLAAFGRTPSAGTPLEVADFHAFWEAIGAERQLAFLGALIVLEGVARHLQGGARQALGQLGLQRGQSRFILVHLDADLEHGARARALCQQLGQGQAEVLLEGARRAADFWVIIHQKALAVA